MENLVKTSVSMPCHKYMIRAIQTEEDKLSYARAFISKLYETGHTNREDIMTCYTATSAFRTKQDFYFLSYHDKKMSPEEFFQAVQKDTSIPHFKSCRDYLKRHPQNISAVCRTCPSYTGYTNRSQKTELAILKFVSFSMANLKYFLTISDAKYFRSCYDLAENVLSDTPFIVPLPRLCFSTILKCGPEYYEQNLLAMTDEDRLSSLQSRVISILRARYNADTVFPDYVRIFPTIWKIFVNEISQSEDLSKSDVKDFIEYTSILDPAAGRKTRPAKTAGPSSMAREDLTLRASQNGSALWETETPGNKTVPSGILAPAGVKETSPVPPADNSSQSEPPERESVPPMQTISDSDPLDLKVLPEDSSPDTVHNQIDAPEAGNGDLGSTLPELSSPDTSSNTSELHEDPTIPPIDISPEDDLPALSQPQTDSSKDICAKQPAAESSLSPSDATIKLSPIRINDIALPVIRQQDLRKYCNLVVDENADFVTVSVARDQTLFLECLQDDKGDHILLIWVPLYHKFYYGEFAYLHRRLKEILAYKSICKVCYQPYYLYSLSKYYAVPARNVYSIFSVHVALTGFNVSMTYQDIIEMYTCGKRFEQMVANVPVLNNFIGGLPLYETIYHNLKQIVDKVPSLQKKIARSFLLDEVNGTSYMRCINFEDTDLLFTFCKDGTIQYNNNYVKKVKRNGALVTYVIENTDYTREARRSVYEALLADLAKAGRIRKLNIQLVMLTGDILMIFIGANGFELLDTTIKVMFSKFATDHGIDSFHILVSREWLLADQTVESSHLEDYAAEEDAED